MPLIAHPTSKISPLADIEESQRGTRVVLGAHSLIDSFVKLKPAGGTGDVLIGQRVIINAGCVIYTGNGLVIGDDSAIAANCVFAPVNHAYSRRDQIIRDQRFKPSRGGIVIGRDVWIGAGCVLLDGAVVEDGAVIGAMSLVRGHVAAYTVNAGTPLRQIGQRQ